MQYNSTKAIHTGVSPDKENGATGVPIYQSASYSYDSPKDLENIFKGRNAGFVYSRISNPTNAALEQRITQLENGIGAIVTSSGMSAISTLAFGLLKQGDEVITGKDIFGGTISFFQNILSKFGVKTTLVDTSVTEEIEAAITSKTKIILIESITNPGMRVADISEIVTVAKKNNLLLVCDATVTTPVLLKSKEFGIDVVIHSTTKYINGHGTAIGGAIVDTGNYKWQEGIFEDIKTLAKRAGQFALLANLRNGAYRDVGACASPANSALMITGLESLEIRMEKHIENAKKLAEFLGNHKSVKNVNYPGSKNHKHYDRVQKYFEGKGGALLTFDLENKQAVFEALSKLKIVKNMTNLGDAKTLALHPSSTIFADFTNEQKKELGISDNTIRVSVGIENIEDIINDFNSVL